MRSRALHRPADPSPRATGVSPRIVAIGALLLAALAAPAGADDGGTAATSGCVRCHAILSTPKSARPALDFSQADVHASSRLTCADCHGGDPTAADRDAAHDAAKGYRGTPARAGVIALCARCHSDAELMHRYAPRQRVDQVSEYVTSVHGRRLLAGDTRVATCVSCHGAHGIRAVADINSPVFRTNVAKTCATCHADAEYMKGYTRPDGTPLPTTQWADYERSVHALAMTKQNNLSAATCSDCHGSHGAAPPGVDTIVNVCGTCHAVFAATFERGPHRRALAKGCVDCHGNHAVVAPADEQLSTAGPIADAEDVEAGPAGAICGTCHAEGDKSAAAAGRLRTRIGGLRAAIGRAEALTARLRAVGENVDSEDGALQAARTRLMLARLETHSANPAAVEPVIADGLAIVERADSDAERSLTRHVRRARLLAALVGSTIVLVIFALVLTWREFTPVGAFRR